MAEAESESEIVDGVAPQTVVVGLEAVGTVVVEEVEAAGTVVEELVLETFVVLFRTIAVIHI